MIGQERCEAVLSRALNQPNIKEADAYLSVQDLNLTRFASNDIHQNVSHSNAQLHIRVVVGKRQGRATTNDLSDGGIQKAAKLAHQNALLMPEDPGFNGLPSPDAPPQVATHDLDTASYNPDFRAKVVASVCGLAADGGLEASGFFRNGTQESAVMSTKGAKAYHVGTFAGLLVMAISDTSAGWSKGGSWRVEDIDSDALAAEAVDKALKGQNPQPVEPGEYTVVLDPYAVDDMLSSLSLYGMGALAVQEGRSWMNGLIGEQAMSPLISIWDDGADMEGWPVPFDAEGVPRQRTQLIQDGVVLEPVHNSYTAGKDGKQSTGHQYTFTGPPVASNLFMKSGDSSLEKMISSTQRGLYITRFHYTRVVHNRNCVMTGMTRDGTFLIENGHLTHPVKDLRFTQSYVEALAEVESVGSQSKLMLNEVGFATKVPALKISRFNFTGVTV